MPALQRIHGLSHLQFHLADGETRGTAHPIMGIELEVEAQGMWRPKDIVDAMSQYNDDTVWYYHGDGSLRNGVELVTHPMSFRYFQERFDDRGIQAIERMAAPWSNGYDTAGVHIHMDKQAFNDRERYRRFMMFHYTRTAACKTVAKRAEHAERWGSFTHYNWCRGYNGPERPTDIVNRILDGHCSCRGATNITNRNTIEFRYFRSTTNHLRFRGYVEWLAALYHYAGEGVTMTKKGALEFMRAHPGEYDNAIGVLLQYPTHKAETPQSWEAKHRNQRVVQYAVA